MGVDVSGSTELDCTDNLQLSVVLGGEDDLGLILALNVHCEGISEEVHN